MSGNAMNELFAGSGDPIDPDSKTPGSGIVVAVCAAIATIALFMEWATDDLFDKSRNAWNVPMQFLWDTTPASFDELPVVWAVLVGIILMIGGAVRRSARACSVAGSVLVVLWSAWYVQGVRSAIDYYEFEQGLGDLVGTGAWLCLVAGLVGFVASIAYVRAPRTA